MDTFPRLLLEQTASRPDATAIREKRYGIWQALSWQELSTLVNHLACGLHHAGLQRGEHVALISTNRVRLYAMMLAIQSLGAIPVPFYEDAVASEFTFPLNNTKVRFVLAEDQEQVDKLLEIRDQCPLVERIYYDENRGMRNYHAPGLESLDSLIKSGAEHCKANPDLVAEEIQKGSTQDSASLFFTSGTTSLPKGVVHTYHSLISSARAGAEFDKLTHKEEVIAYLPPAWIGQNIFSYAQWLVCGYIVHCPEDSSTIAIDLKEIGPTYYFAPPRVYESLLTNVMNRMEDAGWFKRTLFNYFMNVARDIGPARMNRQRVSPGKRLLYFLGDIMIYGPLRNTLGFSRIRIAYTAGEAIGPDLFTFYRSLGINLKQLYGTTELAVFVCLQADNNVHIDTVGEPISGVELKIADNGEILVRSMGTFKEYFNDPEATAEVLNEDGWYATSDAGFLDQHGQLKVIDRVKDVGRIVGGPYDGALFAPKYVENKLKFFPYIKEVVAFGHNRDTVCVMLNIDFDAVGNWAERRSLAYAGYTDLAQKQEVYELMLECINAVNQELNNDPLLKGSQIHRFLVLHKELDADDGELTRTNKVRRGFIEEKYKPLVDAMYAGKTEQDIATEVRFEDGRTSMIHANLKIWDSSTFQSAPQQPQRGSTASATASTPPRDARMNHPLSSGIKE